MSIIEQLSETAASIGKTMRKPMSMALMGAACLLGGKSLAQTRPGLILRSEAAKQIPANDPTSTDYVRYEDMHPGQRDPRAFFHAGFKVATSDHPLYTGTSFKVGGEYPIVNHLSLEGGYEYRFDDPNSFAVGGKYNFINPFVGRTSGAYVASWSPSHAMIGVVGTTGPHPVEARAALGFEAYFGSGNIFSPIASPQGRVELGFNLGNPSAALNGYIGVGAEMTHVNKASGFFGYGLPRGAPDNATTFFVSARLNLHPAKR